MSESQILAGCQVAICGKLPYRQRHSWYKDEVRRLGGRYSDRVNSRVTHLIATQHAVNKQVNNVQHANFIGGIHIVSHQWLLCSLSAGQKADETQFLLTPSAEAVAVTAAAAKAAKTQAAETPSAKRKRDEVKDEDQTSDEEQESDNADASVIDDGVKKIKLDEAAQGVPVDFAFYRTGYSVYIGEGGDVYDATLNSTTIEGNSNKCYRMQLLHHPTNAQGGGPDYVVWMRWGRVGDRCGKTCEIRKGSSLAEAEAAFERKFQEKTGRHWNARNAPPVPGKYTFIERSYEPDSDDEGSAARLEALSGKMGQVATPVASRLHPAVQELVGFFFSGNVWLQLLNDLKYDTDQLPLGKLSKGTISRGFAALNQLAEHLRLFTCYTDIKEFQAETTRLSNQYYSLIPHLFSKVPEIRTWGQIKAETELLETLSGIKDMDLLRKIGSCPDIHPTDRLFSTLRLREMAVISPFSDEYQELKRCFSHSIGQTHTSPGKLVHIFRILREDEADRADDLDDKDEDASAPANRRLLWHGSLASNMASILSKGLCITPAEKPLNGAMFGRGIYLADMSSKSANYMKRQPMDKFGLLLLCEVNLGKMFERSAVDYMAAENARSAGCHSTIGVGRTGPQA